MLPVSIVFLCSKPIIKGGKNTAQAITMTAGTDPIVSMKWEASKCCHSKAAAAAAAAVTLEIDKQLEVMHTMWCVFPPQERCNLC